MRTAPEFDPGMRAPRVADGFGWIQIESGPRKEETAGDVIWLPPGVRHWHDKADN